MDKAHKARDAQRDKWYREELVDRMVRVLPDEGIAEPFPGLSLYRWHRTTEPIHGVAETSLCIIAQGSKDVFLADDCYRYDPNHYLLATADVPVMGRIRQASKSQPFLALRLVLDATLVGSVLMEMGQTQTRPKGTAKALAVSPLESPLLEAVVRLVRLIETPMEARLLAPALTREVVFRLLLGAQRDRLARMIASGSHAPRIARAIGVLRKKFNRPLPIEDLAKQAGMSVSSFHSHFKQVTSLSPLQFQKQLRLQEARQLLLGGELDAATVAFRVGYEDPSQFNREYKRMFGVPPIRDAKRLRSP